MLNYASNIFKESGSDMDPNTSAIIMILVQMLGTWATTFLIDRVGRRVLLMASTIGSGTGLALMGTFIFLSHQDLDLSDLSWIPVASLSLTVFMAAIGLLPLSFVVLGEVLPSKVCFAVQKNKVTFSSYFLSCIDSRLGFHIMHVADQCVSADNCKSFSNASRSDWILHVLLVFRMRLLCWTTICDFCVTRDKWKEHKCAVEHLLSFYKQKL